MRWTLRRSLAAMAFAGLLALPDLASAGLGKVQVLSQSGDRFAALIPFVDVLPGNAVEVELADRNRYPMLAPYSASADQLTFTLQRALDGTPTGVLVMGPKQFAETDLHFAVSMRWGSGGAVREYDIDTRRLAALPAGPDRPVPAHDDGGKAAAGSPHPPALADGLTLGGMTVLSRPGEPFVGEVRVLGSSPAPGSRLRVRISPAGRQARDDSRQVDFLSSITPVLMRNPAGRYVLRLSSASALLPGRLHFRLDLTLGEAHLSRLYRLDAADPTAAATAASTRDGRFNRLQVAPGDTLSDIVDRLDHPGVGRLQAMARLYLDNPHAFGGGDRDRLLAGAELKYPQGWAPAGSRAPQPPAATAAPAPRPAAAAPASAPVAPTADARAATLRARLRQQEQQLMQAHRMTDALERRLDQLLHQKPAAASPSVPWWSELTREAGALPAQLADRLPLPAELRQAVLPGSAALVAAAVATALLLRRRRLRAGRLPPDNPEEGVTVTGLQQWLRYDPSRDDLRFRLLQLLASRDERQTFIAEAEVARSRFAPDSPLWLGVLAMGRELAPDYPWDDAGDAAPVADDAALQAPADPAPATAAAQPPVVAAVPPPLPERPLTQAGSDALTALDAGTVVFNDTVPPQPVDLPQQTPLDKRALAELFAEMGDQASADELLRALG